jgi:hypothetical protein
MRADDLVTVWDIACPSRDAAVSVRERLLREAQPDAVFLAQVADADGRSPRQYRIGDLFERVTAEPLPVAEARLRLTFVRRPDADRYWKDVMIRLVRTAESSCTGARAALAFRGDPPPASNPAESTVRT